MDKKHARMEAEALLNKLIAHQPTLICSEHGHANLKGGQVAKFCIDFVSTYIEERVKMQD